MERITLRVPKEQVREVEQMVETGEFPNRSEAIRDAIRRMLKEEGRTRAPGRTRPWKKV